MTNGTERTSFTKFQTLYSNVSNYTTLLSELSDIQFESDKAKQSTSTWLGFTSALNGRPRGSTSPVQTWRGHGFCVPFCLHRHSKFQLFREFNFDAKFVLIGLIKKTKSIEAQCFTMNFVFIGVDIFLLVLMQLHNNLFILRFYKNMDINDIII